MIFNDVLQDLIDRYERTRCGCGESKCKKCRSDRITEDVIEMGKKHNVPLDDTEREQFEALNKMFYHTVPEKMPDTYFISGEAGEKDEDGLPECISVCPAYGVGWSILYRKEVPSPDRRDERFTPVTEHDIIKVNW